MSRKIKFKKNKSNSKRSLQISFQGSVFKNSMVFGGNLLKNSHAKTKRFIDTKNSIHLVLRSSIAKQSWSLRTPRNMKIIREIIYAQAKKYGIAIEQYANASNHLHLLIKVNNRFTYSPFIRAVTGAIALKVTGAFKGQSYKKSRKGKFWDFRPFTRIVRGYKAKFVAQYYILQNELEALGIIAYHPRQKISTA